LGDERLKAAVLDAGPLIHLDQIGCLQFLEIFDSIHIPDAVWKETVENERYRNINILGLSSVQRHTLSHESVVEFIRKHDLGKLHSGEVECLYLCQMTDISILLTDDLAVREAAKRLKITPVGSLGIVVKAYRQGRIPITDAESHIADLYNVSSLFVSRVIVEIAIEQLCNKFNKN